MTTFKYIYKLEPVDFWAGATIAPEDETKEVLAAMPEAPRGEIVFKVYVPAPRAGAIVPAWLCKADNNGTTYLFSHVNLYIKED